MAPKTQVKDDPNTFIPPAVRKMAAQADAAFRAQSGQPPQESPGAAPSEAPPETLPPADPPGAAPSFAPPPEVTPQVTPPEQVSEESWERRYKSMEGRYKRAEGDIHSMSSQLASMQSLLASMQKPSSETPAELRPQSLLTPEEVSEYGSEFLSVVAKKAKEELTPEVAALRQKLINLEKQLSTTAEQNNAKARFELESALDQRIPHWRDINVLPDFHAWLALPDMYSGAIRHELLRTAYAQNNTPRVLAFFKGFLDQEAAFVPQGQQSQPVENGKLSLEDLAAPGRAKTSAATLAPAEKPIITRAQISQFYADSASGKYRGREAEKGRLEAMIFDAEREGRIR